MTNFDYAIALIFRLEGGYSNHPLDRGGPTKFGITLGMLQAHRGVVTTARDVEAMTEMEARNVYLSIFWNPNRLGRIASKDVALVVFAHLVHTGPISAIKALQKTLNVNFGAQLYIDGVFGSKTEITLHMIKDEKLLARKLIQNIQIYYVEICEGRRDQLVFLRGWLNRSFHLCDAIS